MSENLQLVLQQVEQQRNAALNAAAVNAAHGMALEQQLNAAGAEIADLRVQLARAQDHLQLAKDDMAAMASLEMRNAKFGI